MKRYSFEDYNDATNDIVNMIKGIWFSKETNLDESAIELESMRIFTMITISVIIDSKEIYDKNNGLVNLDRFFCELKSHVLSSSRLV